MVVRLQAIKWTLDAISKISAPALFFFDEEDTQKKHNTNL